MSMDKKEEGTKVAGKFQLGEVIGKGGFAKVYKGLNTETGDFVAVKQISLNDIRQDQLDAIKAEIGLLRMLDHPNIVKYIDSGETADHFFIALEYVESGSLAHILKKFGPLNESLVSMYIAQVLDGLVYLHEQGVVHRDVKGANLLTTKDGLIKLADFGVSAKLEEEKNGDASVVGTPYWMAPEVIEMSSQSTASDIWSVGCTIIELQTGIPPYYDLLPMPALFRIVQDDHPPLPDDISPACRDFLIECFQKDPNLRASATKLRQHPWVRAARKKMTNTSNTNWQGKLRSLLKGEPEEDLDIEGAKTFKRSWMRRGGAPRAARRTREKGRGKSYPLSKQEQEGDELDDEGMANRKDEPEPNDGDACDLVETLVTPRDRTSGNEGVRQLSKHADMLGSVATAQLKKYMETCQQESYDELATNNAEVDWGARLQKRMSVVWDDFLDADENVDAMFEELMDPEFEEVASTKELHVRLSQQVLNYMSFLKPTEEKVVIREACSKLVSILKEHPNVKNEVVAYRGAMAILDMLEMSDPDVICSVLQVVNQIICSDKAFQEYLTVVGAIPAVIPFASDDYPKSVRLEAATFFRHMFSAGLLPIQMFTGCRGLPMLTRLMEPNYKEHRELVLFAIDGVVQIFESHSMAHKNDFCRLFARSGILQRLGVTLQNVLKDETATGYPEKVISILVWFSQGDSLVKIQTCTQDLLSRVLQSLHHVSYPLAGRILKIVRNLSLDQVAHEPLYRAGAVARLIPFLEPCAEPLVAETHNLVLSSLFALCRVNKLRQEEAAVNGIIPHLQHFIQVQSPLKEFALPMYCDLALASQRSRMELYKYHGVEFFLEVMRSPNWVVNSLEAIISCLQGEPGLVEDTLVLPQNVEKLAAVFDIIGENRTEQALEPLMNMLSFSPRLCAALGNSPFVASLLVQLNHRKAIVRKNILHIFISLYRCYTDGDAFVRDNELEGPIGRIAEFDSSALVKEMANRLRKAFGSEAQRRTLFASMAGVNVRRYRNTDYGGRKSSVSGLPSPSTTKLHVDETPLAARQPIVREIPQSRSPKPKPKSSPRSASGRPAPVHRPISSVAPPPREHAVRPPPITPGLPPSRLRSPGDAGENFVGGVLSPLSPDSRVPPRSPPADGLMNGSDGPASDAMDSPGTKFVNALLSPQRTGKDGPRGRGSRRGSGGDRGRTRRLVP